MFRGRAARRNSNGKEVAVVGERIRADICNEIEGGERESTEMEEGGGYQRRGQVWGKVFD